MKETNDIPLISSIFQPLEKLRISGGYGPSHKQMRKRNRLPRKNPDEGNVEKEKNEKDRERESIIDITV